MTMTFLLFTLNVSNIRKDIQERFNELLNISMADWILNPFEVQPNYVEREIQVDLIGFQIRFLV